MRLIRDFFWDFLRFRGARGSCAKYLYYYTLSSVTPSPYLSRTRFLSLLLSWLLSNPLLSESPLALLSLFSSSLGLITCSHSLPFSLGVTITHYPRGVATCAKETYYSAKRDLLQCQNAACEAATCRACRSWTCAALVSVKRDLE